MIDIAFRSEQLENKLAQLAIRAGVDYGKVIKEEGRFVTQILVKFTPPKNLSEGRNAVAGDMTKLSVPLNYEYFQSKATEGGFYKSTARYVRNRQTDKLNLLFQNPNFSGFYGLRMINSFEELSQNHQQLRNKRGRISKKTNFASYSADYKKLRNEIQSRVGWTVSGWIPAAKATGARYKKFSDRFGQSSGIAVFNFGRNPFILAKNKNVKIPNYQRMVDGALRSRISTTEKKLEAVLAGRAVNLGFIRVKGGRPVQSAQAA
jgi:hypothetical protein